MSFKLSINNRFHFVLSVFFCCVISYLCFQVILEKHYPTKQLYHGADITFVNTVGVRTSDYMLKLDNQAFLIAPNIPNELRLRIELADAGRYSAILDAQYPDWLCEDKDLDQAIVDITGGSLNENIKLIRYTSQELKFVAAKGQELFLRVRNPKNRECGRAVLTLYQEPNFKLFKTSLFLMWFCVFLLCLFSASSPYIVALGLFFNTLLLTAEATLGELTTASVLVNTGFALGFSGVLFFISSISFKSRFIAFFATLCTALLLSPALAFIAYENVFSAPFAMEAVHGAMQSYGSQAIEFWSEFVGMKQTLYLLFALFLLYLCLRQLNQAKAIASKTIVFGLILSLSGCLLSFGKLHNSGIYNLLLESYLVYQWEIDAYEKVSSERLGFTEEATRKVEHSDDTTVIVVGESVNKKEMSAYGHFRQTTPNLDRRIANDEVVLFTNTYSNHTHSNQTMSLILTQADQYREKTWQESPSIFNFASGANVETQWLTNHRLLGGWSNHITTIIREADRLKTINYKIGYGIKSNSYDHELVPLFEQAIEERPNQLTFLHLYNSHSQYCNRYPSDFKKFGSDFSLINYGRLGHIKEAPVSLIDCYDNTIHYSDHVLEQIIEELDKRENPSVLLYVADHAEEVLGNRTHNSALFTFDMINIPLVVWANKAWREKHSGVWVTLNSNRDKVVTNDLMFESILGLAGITAASINTDYDISNPNYIEPSNPLTLHKKIEINHKDNWNYWQRQNLRFAKNNDLDLEVVNVESVGEAKVAEGLGLNRLQINVELSAQNELMLVSNKSNEVIASVADFIVALEKNGVPVITLVLTPTSEIVSTQVHDIVSTLSERASFPLQVVAKRQGEPINLAALDFVKQVEVANRNSQSLPVILSSRYTMPPPEPSD